jgi:hypothetical protein
VAAGQAAIAGLGAGRRLCAALGWAIAHGTCHCWRPTAGTHPVGAPGLVVSGFAEFVGVGYRYGHLAGRSFCNMRCSPRSSSLCGRRRPSLRSESAPTDMLLLTPPTVALLCAASGYTWWTGEPRYLFVAPGTRARHCGIGARFPGRSLDTVAAQRMAEIRRRRILAVWAGTSATFLTRHHDDGPRDLPGCLTAATARLGAWSHACLLGLLDRDAAAVHAGDGCSSGRSGRPDEIPEAGIVDADLTRLRGGTYQDPMDESRPRLTSTPGHRGSESAHRSGLCRDASTGGRARGRGDRSAFDARWLTSHRHRYSR